MHIHQNLVSTVRRQLNEFGLRGVTRRKPFISLKNRKARLCFIKEHIDWTQSNSGLVLWSDKSKFNLVSSDGIQYVRHLKNERCNPRYQVPTVKHGGRHVSYEGIFFAKGIDPLFRVFIPCIYILYSVKRYNASLYLSRHSKKNK
ncbi:hypothetical protein HZH66_011452 [Vespula vulgaris]|uniref:Transposase Tc1-like domain-containing protein n=1 Tax=Vespula vulgaris TaxID=7454 RepID=A0A834MVQ6_VESVU|nr:hypothetical protein HZH66_011452 [Vespula vulgaris]